MSGRIESRGLSITCKEAKEPDNPSFSAVNEIFDCTGWREVWCRADPSRPHGGSDVTSRGRTSALRGGWGWNALGGHDGKSRPLSGCSSGYCTSIPLMRALSVTVVKTITYWPLELALAVNDWMSARFCPPAVFKTSKLESTCVPLMLTLNTR